MVTYVRGGLLAALVVASCLPGSIAKAREVTAADREGPDGIVYPDFSRAGIPGGIPDVPVVVKAADFGAVPSDGKDDSPAIQEAIREAVRLGGGAVLLSEGDFDIDHTVTLSDDGVVLRGADRAKTRLLPRFEGQTLAKPFPQSFTVQITGGSRALRWKQVPLTRPTRRGDFTVQVADGSTVRVGDVVVVTAHPPADAVAILGPELQKFATDKSYGSIYSYQFARVRKVDGNEITLDRPVRLELLLEQKPALNLANNVRRSGVENLTIQQLVSKKGISGIGMDRTDQCWVRDVTVLKVGNRPVDTERSFEFEHRGLIMDESLSRGGAVAYYSFSFCGDGLVEDVKATRLRHVSVMIVSNGNVFRHCFFENVDINFHLIWPYENLFEQCHIDNTLGPHPAEGETSRGAGSRAILVSPPYNNDMHLPAGPRNTFFNNDVISREDAIMLGGHAPGTIVAYNTFDVQNGVAAIIKKGVQDSLFIGNVFILENPLQRNAWQANVIYESDDPESLIGAVIFPNGSQTGTRFIDNRFFGVPNGIFYANGKPALDKDNVAASVDHHVPSSDDPDRIALAGPWQAIVTRRLDPAPSADQAHADPGISAEAKRWLDDAGDSEGWKEYSAPGAVESIEADSHPFDGEIVLSRDVKVPAPLASRELVLSFGGLDDNDTTFINGTEVGATSGENAWRTPRLYRVPAGTLREGRNRIAIRLWDKFGGGGIVGLKNDLFLGLPRLETPPATVIPKERSRPPFPSLQTWQREQTAKHD